MLLDGYYFRCFFFFSPHIVIILIKMVIFDCESLTLWPVSGELVKCWSWDISRDHRIWRLSIEWCCNVFYAWQSDLHLFFLASTSVYDANGLWFLQKLLKCCWFLSLPILWLRNNNIHCWRKKKLHRKSNKQTYYLSIKAKCLHFSKMLKTKSWLFVCKFLCILYFLV